MSQLSHTRRLQGNRSHTAEAEPGQEAIFEAGHPFFLCKATDGEG